MVLIEVEKEYNMAKFFNYYPKTFYTSNTKTTGLDSVTNIISRFGFEKELKNNSSAFYKYSVKDSDTPEIIASKFYDNSERHWIVLLFNDIIDPQFDWPLNNNTLIEFIDNKYTANGAANTTPVSGIQWAKSTNNTKNYYKIITRTASDSTIITEKFQVDANTYANVAASTISYTLNNGATVTEKISKEKQTYYDYEVEENEAKREIRLLKSEFVPEVEKEFKRVIKL
jgi:hypothetical protein